MSGHPHDASDPSSADSLADATRAEVRSGQEYLLRDIPAPRQEGDIAALTADRDEARDAMYRAQREMMRTQDRCAALRVENIKLRGEWTGNLRAILLDHWPVYVQFNHADGKDQVVCACSRVQLPWGKSVGEAVGYWVEHVIEQLGTRTKEAQSMALDDAAPRAIIANLTAERDELRAEVGQTFKQLCDAATLAGVREQERDEARAEVGALTQERDALTARLALLDSPELLERLADLEHARWSGWEAWRAIHRTPENEARWYRQRWTAYDELGEGEKESDRAEARKGLTIIKAMMGEASGDT